MNEETEKEREAIKLEYQKSEEEIGKLPESIEDIERNPILKPLLDYLKASAIHEKEDDRETEYLEEKMKELNELYSTEIFTDSPIAKIYENIFEIYKRMLWIYIKNLDLANKKIAEMKKIVDKYYITNKEHEEEVERLQEEIEKEKEKGV